MNTQTETVQAHQENLQKIKRLTVRTAPKALVLAEQYSQM